MEIVVCPLSRVAAVAAARKATRVVSLLDPDGPFPVLKGLPADAHLKVQMHDIAEMFAGLTPPDRHHVETVLEFGQAWDRAAPIIIHCWAGISRSTASAFTLACAINPEADEREIARTLRAASPTASPNRRIIAFADEILGRQGRMRAAIDAIGRGVLADEAIPFAIPAHFPAGPER